MGIAILELRDMLAEVPILFGMLVLGYLVYIIIRPMRDYYVLQRMYYNRIHDPPSRGSLFSENYDGFDSYLAAKAAFECMESYNILNDCNQEAEHIVLVVPARSKAAAVERMRKNKGRGGYVIHKTPFTLTLQRRRTWAEADRESREYEQRHKAEG